MYAQNLPPSRKLGVWEISPIFSRVWRWPSFKLEVGFKLYRKNSEGEGIFIGKIGPCDEWRAN